MHARLALAPPVTCAGWASSRMLLVRPPASPAQQARPVPVWHLQVLRKRHAPTVQRAGPSLPLGRPHAQHVQPAHTRPLLARHPAPFVRQARPALTRQPRVQKAQHVPPAQKAGPSPPVARLPARIARLVRSRMQRARPRALRVKPGRTRPKWAARLQTPASLAQEESTVWVVGTWESAKTLGVEALITLSRVRPRKCSASRAALTRTTRKSIPPLMCVCAVQDISPRRPLPRASAARLAWSVPRTTGVAQQLTSSCCPATGGRD
jgi:hypothetical protein